jgi:hypothetical protein
MEIKMVNVKLAARCLVNGQIREAGEVVDLPEKALDAEGKLAPYAAVFGEVMPVAEAKVALKKAQEKAEKEAAIIEANANAPGIEPIEQ